MNTEIIVKVCEILAEEYHKWEEPIVTQISKTKRDPFRVLIATIISQRTKDEVTREASKRLFSIASTPEEMSKLKAEDVEQCIYPAGFYRNKARHIIEAAGKISETYGGRVPDTLEELLNIRGVGRKTANLVLTLGFSKQGICVDTHVHRISNRFGYVRTKSPDETEFALRKKLPPEWWIPYNDLLVAHGQNVCRPISPRCSECSVETLCEKKGVTSL